jgi:hypothetical protein
MGSAAAHGRSIEPGRTTVGRSAKATARPRRIWAKKPRTTPQDPQRGHDQSAPREQQRDRCVRAELAERRYEDTVDACNEHQQRTIGAAGSVNNRSLVNAARTKMKGADVDSTTERVAIGRRTRASLQRATEGCARREGDQDRTERAPVRPVRNDLCAKGNLTRALEWLDTYAPA